MGCRVFHGAPALNIPQDCDGDASMFAKSSLSDVYHLLQADEEQTLCGLVVAPVIIDRPVKSAHLHLTSGLPQGMSICEGCASVDGSNRRFRVEELPDDVALASLKRLP